MEKRKTKKKVTSFVGGDSSHSQGDFTGAKRLKKHPVKAIKFRIFAVIFWVAALAYEVFAIVELRKDPIDFSTLIIFILADLIFVIVGSVLWKKANRFNPASEKQRVKFFLQNQLGVIISVIAFLPLVFLLYKNKNLAPKQKKIVGSVAVFGLLIAVFFGIDFNPPSIEQYQEETVQVKALNNGLDYVYWTTSGKRYHLYEDCSYINTKRTVEIFEGTVMHAKEMKRISELCDRCQQRSKKQYTLGIE